MSNGSPAISKVCVAAIAGGSGAGKTWLARRLVELLDGQAVHLSLDDFYRDRSHLPPKRRARLNFDIPRAIDWEALREAVARCRRAERAVQIPRYDFSSHRRLAAATTVALKPVVIVEGLWLFHRPNLRALFDLRIFVDCPHDLRLSRRMERDVLERGRTADSVDRQFRTTVAPMHERHIQPQAKWADETVVAPLTEEAVVRLAEIVRAKSKTSPCLLNN